VVPFVTAHAEERGERRLFQQRCAWGRKRRGVARGLAFLSAGRRGNKRAIAEEETKGKKGKRERICSSRETEGGAEGRFRCRVARSDKEGRAVFCEYNTARRDVKAGRYCLKKGEKVGYYLLLLSLGKKKTEPNPYSRQGGRGR